MTSPDAGTVGGELPDFEQLFKTHLNPLTRFVFSYVKSWEVAEDIVHDVFMQLWLRYRNLEPVRDMSAYLYTIARYDAAVYGRASRPALFHIADALEGRASRLSVSNVPRWRAVGRASRPSVSNVSR